MCKNGFSPIGDYVGKRLTGLPFRPNANVLAAGKRELTLSPLRLGTAGMTLFEQINNTTLNIQSRSLYGRHVSISFLHPVFGAMMKQACRQTLKSLAAECLVGVRLGR